MAETRDAPSSDTPLTAVKAASPGFAEHGVALAYFTLLTLAVTWPLALHFTDRIPGWYVADNYEFLWKMWWFKRALVDLRQNPLFAPHIFYPYGFPLAHAELSPLLTVAGLPLTWVWGEVPTYNLLSVLSFVVSGWAAFALVRRWTGNLWAGLFAGTLFALSPYHMVRYGGILPSASVEGIPLFFLGLERWAEGRRLRDASLAAMGFALAAWAYLYYAFGLALLGPLYAWLRLRPLRPVLRDRATWKAVGLVAFICLLFLGPELVPYLRLSRQLDLVLPLEEADFWSASPTDYLLPTGLHPIWGAWVRSRFLTVPPEHAAIGLEFVLSTGYLALVFALYGWRHGRGRWVRPLAWTTLGAFVLSLGPRLHVGRHPFLLPAPAPVVTGFHQFLEAVARHLPAHESYAPLQEDGLPLLLPALGLRWLLPPLLGMRAWNRFAGFAAMGVALFAGAGLSAWLGREVGVAKAGAEKAWRVRLASGAVLALALFELWPAPIPLQPIEPRPVDLWLAEQPGQFAIMELPLVSALSGAQMLYTRYHGKRITFAYGTYFPRWYRQSFPELERCPEPDCVARLAGWEVRYVLINEAIQPEGVRLTSAFREAPSFRPVGRFGNIVVFELLSATEGMGGRR